MTHQKTIALFKTCVMGDLREWCGIMQRGVFEVSLGELRNDFGIDYATPSAVGGRQYQCKL